MSNRVRRLFDIEADGLLDTVSKIHCIVIRDLDTGEKWVSNEQPDHENYDPGYSRAVGLLDEADELWGHNIQGYDLPALNLVLGFEWEQESVRDTLLLSRLCWSQVIVLDERMRHIDRKKGRKRLPKRVMGAHSLEAWGFRMGEHKGGFGESTDWSQWSQEMEDYCEQDVEVNEKLARRIIRKNPSPQSIELEHRFSDIIRAQEANGFHVNVQRAHELHAELTAAKAELIDELQAIFPSREEEMKTPQYWELLLCEEPAGRFTTKTEAAKYRRSQGWAPADCEYVRGPNKVKEIAFNPGSRQQIVERLQEKYGWEPTVFTDKGNPKVDEKVLANLEYPEAEKLIDYLTVEKRISQLANGQSAILKHEKDGVIYGSVITNGTRTGRCSHSRPNVAQTPKVKKGEDGIKYGRDGYWGYEFRELYHARPGWNLIGADASGIEGRGLAHFLHPYDGGEYVEVILHGDLHTANQKAAGLYSRDSAKTFFYAYIYGAGAEKVGKIRAKDARDAGHPIPKKKGEDDETYHKRLGSELKDQFESRITGFKDLVHDVKDAAGYYPVRRGRKVFWRKKDDKFTTLKGLDGRRLPVPSAHSALNTVLQSFGAVVMKAALVILDDRLQQERGLVRCTRWWEKINQHVESTETENYAYCANVHDEWQIEAEPDHVEVIKEEAVRAFEEAGKELGVRCPLTGEAGVGFTWAETH